MQRAIELQVYKSWKTQRKKAKEAGILSA